MKIRKKQFLMTIFLLRKFYTLSFISLSLISYCTSVSAQSANSPPPSPRVPGLPEIIVPSQSDEVSSEEQKSNSQSTKSTSKSRAKSENRTETGALKDGTGSRADEAIVALVNDEPITGYEISQRQRLMSMGNPKITQKAQANFKALIQSPSTNDQLKSILDKIIKENPNKSRNEIIAIFDQRKKEFAKRLQEQAIDSARKSLLPNLRKDAIDELIDERLKLQEAKKINAIAGDEEVNKIIQSIAEKNKMNEKEFAEYLKKTGADINILKSRFKANMSWQEVIRRRFGPQISITERDVDRFVEKASSANENKIELLIHRIIMPVPTKMDQKQVTLRMSNAEALLKKGGGCEKMSVNASMIPEAKFEDLGFRVPDSIPEPTRTLLLNSKDGELLPPIMGPDGIEIWAVCSRKNITNNEEKRQNAQAELRQKEFEVLAKKHLNDLRQDAAIEYR